MGSGADTHDITRFSQEFHYGEQTPGQTSSFSHHDPRWTPRFTNTSLTGTSDCYHHFDDTTDDGQSEYTTASTEPLRTYTATTTVRSSLSRSVFSSRSGGSSYMGQSSAPSVGYTGPTFEQQFANPNPDAGAGHDSLWCEFSELLGCHATFRLDNVFGWIDHHVYRHLKDSYPRKLMCWFCDHVPFEASSDKYGDLAANFEERMQHIREHIFSDQQRWTSEEVRPDFHLVKHLHWLGQIDDETYQHAMRYEETPAQFRLPGTSSSPSLTTRPLGQLSSAPRRHQERGEIHDLRKERRNREKTGGKERHRGESSKANRR